MIWISFAGRMERESCYVHEGVEEPGSARSVNAGSGTQAHIRSSQHKSHDFWNRYLWTGLSANASLDVELFEPCAAFTIQSSSIYLFMCRDMLLGYVFCACI